MKSIVLSIVLSLLLASSAFAANPARGTGNFRRAEALKVVGAKNARVVGLPTSNSRLVGKGGKNFKNSRILFVEHKVANQGVKVDIVKAPLNKSLPVTRMTKSQANQHGLVTQSQAKQIAAKNGGTFGGSGKAVLENAGIGAKRASYKFNQTSPKSVDTKQFGQKIRASQITRTVSVTGEGESAQAGRIKRLDR